MPHNLMCLQFGLLAAVGTVLAPLVLLAADKAPQEICRQFAPDERTACIAGAELLMNNSHDTQGDVILRVEAVAGRIGYRYDAYGPAAQAVDCAATDTLIVPAGRPVRLLVTSADAVYTWRVSSLGISRSLVPGRINEILVQPITHSGRIDGRLLDEAKGANKSADIEVVGDAYDADGRLKPEVVCKG